MTSRWRQIKDDAALRQRLATRGRIISGTRGFFVARGFQEVETPTVVRYPGMEPNLQVMGTTLMDESGRRYGGHLITSPEYALKKLLAAGYERVFEITRCYRDGEPWSRSKADVPGAGPVTHNPEFTMIEWYRTQADYRDLMADTEQLAVELARTLHGSEMISYQGRQLDLSAPWPRLTVAEAFARHAGIDLGRGIDDPEWFRAAAVMQGHALAETDSFDDIFFRVFLRDVEPRLGRGEGSAPDRPMFLIDYPRSQAALARLKPEDGRYAERFEAYAGGLELANAFSELNDAVEQRRRLVLEAAERQTTGNAPWEIDEDFVAAVGAMPPAAGIALGLDRLVMLLTDARDIRDVLFFPASELFE